MSIKKNPNLSSPFGGQGAVIPNLFTLLNLFFGCLAIIFTMQNGIDIIYDKESGQQFINLNPERIYFAAVFIFCAAIFDFLDGFAARLLKSSSPIGKQLDSLADVVSFGVAPGCIVYQFLRMAFMRDQGGIEASLIWLLPALIVPCAAAFRLAKFNLDEGQSHNFKGLPTPAMGLLIASLPLIYFYNENDVIRDILNNKWVLYITILIVSYLMISNIPFMGMKFKDYSVKNNLPKMILIVVAVISAVFLQWIAVPVIFISYFILSIVNKNKFT